MVMNISVSYYCEIIIRTISGKMTLSYSSGQASTDCQETFLGAFGQLSYITRYPADLNSCALSCGFSQARFVQHVWFRLMNTSHMKEGLDISKAENQSRNETS